MNDKMDKLKIDHDKMIRVSDYILYWNKSNINELFEAVTYLKDLCDKWEYDINRFIKIDQLPSNYIPDMVKTYPIWSMDNFGRCLVGEGYNFSIESIEDIIRSHYKQQF